MTLSVCSALLQTLRITATNCFLSRAWSPSILTTIVTILP